MANKILSLPKISPEFTAFCKGHEFTKNEWMPCPQCGSKDVTKPTGAVGGAIAGVITVAGMLGIASLFLGVGVAALASPDGGAVGLVVVLLIVLAPVLGAGMGSLYKCKSCSFNWIFKNVEELMALSVSDVRK